MNAFCNICGNVKIGRYVLLNGQAHVLPKAVVEDESTVGASSLVLKRVKKGTTVFGVPAIKISP
jgi:serine acetyltransferase